MEAQPGGDSDVDWAEVAQKLGFTVDRVRRKWSRIKNTGAVSEPLFAQLPFAQLPLSYGTNPRNPKVDNSDLVAFFNKNLQDPKPTTAELERFVIPGVRLHLETAPVVLYSEVFNSFQVCFRVFPKVFLTFPQVVRSLV